MIYMCVYCPPPPPPHTHTHTPPPNPTISFFTIFNKSLFNILVSQAVAEKEKEIRANEAQYTYLDIFTNYHTAKITIIFCFEWWAKFTRFYIV